MQNKINKKLFIVIVTGFLTFFSVSNLFSRPDIHMWYVCKHLNGSDCTSTAISCGWEIVSGSSNPCDLYTYWYKDVEGNDVEAKCCPTAYSGTNKGPSNVYSEYGPLHIRADLKVILACNAGGDEIIWDLDASIPQNWGIFSIDMFVANDSVHIVVTEKDSLNNPGAIINIYIPNSTLANACTPISPENLMSSGNLKYPVFNEDAITKIAKVDFTIIKTTNNEIELNFVNDKVSEDKSLKVSIYDLQGKLIDIIKVNSSNKKLIFNTLYLPKGVFLIKAQTNSNSFTSKLLIE